LTLTDEGDRERPDNLRILDFSRCFSGFMR
jgi:hypothetical protein